MINLSIQTIIPIGSEVLVSNLGLGGGVKHILNSMKIVESQQNHHLRLMARNSESISIEAKEPYINFLAARINRIHIVFSYIQQIIFNYHTLNTDLLLLNSRICHNFNKVFSFLKNNFRISRIFYFVKVNFIILSITFLKNMHF